MTKSKTTKQNKVVEKKRLVTNDNIANFVRFKKQSLKREIEYSQRMLKKLIENL